MILQIALDTPLRRVFDYRCPATGSVAWPAAETLRLGMQETTLKRMSGRAGTKPQPIPADLARKMERAEAAIAKIFPPVDEKAVDSG